MLSLLLPNAERGIAPIKKLCISLRKKDVHSLKPANEIFGFNCDKKPVNRLLKNALHLSS